jgi:hypothetical protein
VVAIFAFFTSEAQKEEYRNVWLYWWHLTPQHAGGSAAFSGDNSTKVFAIPHGLPSTPAFVVVTPGSSDASGRFYIVYNSTHVIVNYEIPPPSGDGNVVLIWYAECRS